MLFSGFLIAPDVSWLIRRNSVFGSAMVRTAIGSLWTPAKQAGVAGASRERAGT
jgi:hypothetical protein